MEKFIESKIMDALSPNPLLAAEKLKLDPRIQEAKKLLAEAVREHRSTITKIQPPNGTLKVSYEKLLAHFAELRGAPLWFPYLGSGLGNGTLVELLDGSVKYDFITGMGPHYFGHSHPQLMESSLNAALSDLVMQGNLEQNGEAVVLFDKLVEASGMDHLFLTTSGAMANENALKIAFQSRAPAYRVLAFAHTFTGRTLSMSQLSDKPDYREGLPPNLHVDYIPFYDPEQPEESTKRAVTCLETYLKRYPNSYAAMIFELVQGEAGFYPGHTEFFKPLMQLLKEHNVVIIDDEVQCFGRLPSLFAFHYFGLEAFVDIVTFGKLAYVCGTLFRKELKPRPGLLSQTFTASTSAIQAAITILDMLTKDNFFGPQGKIVAIHRYFTEKLKAIASRHPTLLSGPFGIGCMIAFTPYNGDAKKALQFVHALFEAGVMSFTAGAHPTRVRFLVPAGVVTHAEIDEVCAIIEKTLCMS